eukprot:15470873-Alexandrium_andersonii.AAC.1
MEAPTADEPTVNEAPSPAELPPSEGDPSIPPSKELHRDNIVRRWRNLMWQMAAETNGAKHFRPCGSGHCCEHA